MDLPRSLRGRLVYAGQLAALIGVYILLAELGRALDPVSGIAALVWPPTGISLAVLLIGGYRLWPGIAVGTFVASLWVGVPPSAAWGVALGTTLENVFETFALRSVPGFSAALDRFKDVVSLALVAGVVGTLISATVSTVSLTWGGMANGSSARLWFAWFSGDLVGDLVIVPALLTWARGPRVDTRPAVLLEAGALGAFLIAVAALVFAPRPEAVAGIPILASFVLFLPLTWAALRFGTRGAATAMLLLAVAAVWSTYAGHGAFASEDPVQARITLHLFLASASLASLAVGAVVSDRERSRQALCAEQVALAAARTATRAKDDFLAVLSHELRTPLQSMLGWTQMLRARVHDTATMHKGLATIERNVRVQAQLIEDLLDVSRIVAGELRLASERVDLTEVVASAVESARVAAVAKSIQLNAVTRPVAGVVLGDPDRLHQVVANLLTNALKFTPSGGRIVVRLDREGTTARLVVEDTGRGISPEFLPHVFDRFRQAETGTTRRHGGLGLGLAIVSHLVKLHGGAVKAESPGEGQGAVFTVTLPLLGAERRAVRPDHARESAAATSAALDGIRVLVVDDDPDACEVLEMLLHASGAEVHSTHSVRAAVGELAAFRPDLLLSDLGMPDEDGYTLLREVRARESAGGPHLPAIALTAFASHADREEALALGFEAHLAKPASSSDLTMAVASLVGRAL